jgi:hypothetical protein
MEPNRRAQLAKERIPNPAYRCNLIASRTKILKEYWSASPPCAENALTNNIVAFAVRRARHQDSDFLVERLTQSASRSGPFRFCWIYQGRNEDGPAPSGGVVIAQELRDADDAVQRAVNNAHLQLKVDFGQAKLGISVAPGPVTPRLFPFRNPIE